MLIPNAGAILVSHAEFAPSPSWATAIADDMFPVKEKFSKVPLIDDLWGACVLSVLEKSNRAQEH